MTYVPIVPVTPAAPSPRARELADRLVDVLLEYEGLHPSLTNEEVRQAMQITVQKTRPRASMTAPAVAFGLGILLLGGVAAFYFGGGASTARVALLPIVAATIAVAAVGALVAVLRRGP